jgi:flagellar hook assembly protein FlgD
MNTLGGATRTLRTLAATAAALALAATIAPVTSAVAATSVAAYVPATPSKAKPLVTAAPQFYGGERARFSPNGDGRGDRPSMVYTLGRRSQVVATVRNADKRVIRIVHLGKRPRGESVWTWNAKNKRGRAVTNGVYTIRFAATSVVPRKHPQRKPVRGKATVVAEASTTFTNVSKFSPGPVAPVISTNVPTIYPDTTFFTDALRWSVSEISLADDESVRTLGQTSILAPDGSVVWTHQGAGSAFLRTWTGTYQDGSRVPNGTYTISTTWQDAFGNRAVDTEPVTVAAGSLVEHHTTTTLAAADALVADTPTAPYDSCIADRHGGRTCARVCPPVASERFAGGLSMRRYADCDVAAYGSFVLDTSIDRLDPVRDIVRISATGGPTTPGGKGWANLKNAWAIEATTPAGDGTTTIETFRASTRSASFSVVSPSSISWTMLNPTTYDVAEFTVDVWHYTPPA